MAHVARQADAAGHTPKADGDLEQLSLLCYDLTGLHTAGHRRGFCSMPSVQSRFDLHALKLSRTDQTTC